MAFLQKKKENMREGSRVTAAVFCVFLLVVTTAGCGKVEEPIPVDLSSGNMEELQDGAVRENEDDPEDAVTRDAESDSKDVSDQVTKSDTGEGAGNGSENDEAQKAGQDDSLNESSQQTEETQPNSVGNAELNGNVRSIGADSFVAARAETWSEGDAQYMTASAPGYEGEEDLITVHVDPNCVWEFKTVKNGGINPEDVSSREGSFADLKEGIAINSKGSWQADGSFLADSIVMMIFV